MPKNTTHKKRRGADQHRNAELAKIHIGKKELNLDDDTYRDILFEAEGVESAADLTWKGRAKVLARFAELGFRPALARAAKASKRRPASDPQSRMIRGLWIELHQLGAVRDPSETALARWAHRLTRTDDLAWANDKGLSDCIEALKAWRVRARWDRFTAWLSGAYPGQALPSDLERALWCVITTLEIAQAVEREPMEARLGRAGAALVVEFKSWERDQ